MIYLRLAGGLGNQLFQVAAASLYSQWINQSVSLIKDGLSRYDSPRELLFSQILQPKDGSWYFSNPNSLIGICSGRIRLGRLPIPVLSVNDRHISRPIHSVTFRLPRFMDGYFQQFWTYELFCKALSGFSIRSLPKNRPLSLENNRVAVHIRGSDFLKVKGFDLVDSSFYLNCFSEAIASGYNYFDVYTDDLVYSESILSPIRSRYPCISIEVASSGSVLDDFYGIRSASARIIGNSSFAWWAAALSQGGPTWSTPYIVEQRRRPFALDGEIHVT